MTNQSSPKAINLPFLGLLKTSSWGAHSAHGQMHIIELVAQRNLSVGRFAVSPTREQSAPPRAPEVSAHVTLPAEEGYLVELQVPEGSVGEVNSAIVAALPAHVPLPPGDTMYNYLLFPAEGDRSRLRQAVVSVFPKAVVERFGTLYRHHGITPSSFEMDMQAVARAVIRNGDADSYLIIDMGRENATLAMVARGIARMTASVKTVGKRKVMHIAESADALYRRFYKESNERGDSCEPIRKIILVGHTASVSDAEGIARAARADVELGNVWTNVCSFDEYIPPVTFENSLAYTPAIGAALRKFLP